MTVRHTGERGVANFGWLNSRHTFSFGHYHDPKFMGFGPLRVINEDLVQPGRGFDTHGHQDMEIISYVLQGAMAHKDSMGTGSVIRPGDVQRMTAGTGVRHSEYNTSDSETLHFLQIWIEPERTGLEPSYEQKTFIDKDKCGQLRLVGSRDGRDGSVTIHQDVELYVSVLKSRNTLVHEMAEGRAAWVQVVRGTLQAGEHQLRAGDGLAVDDVQSLELTALEESEFLLFDMGK